MYVCIYGCVESVDYVCMDGELGSTLPSFAAIAPFSPYKTDKVGIIICSRHYTTTGAAYELPEYITAVKTLTVLPFSFSSTEFSPSLHVSLVTSS